MNALVKSINEAYAELVKAGKRPKSGEGSRGGKVIGHRPDVGVGVGDVEGMSDSEEEKVS